MVTLSEHAPTDGTIAGTGAATRPVAQLTARLSAYLVDSLVLLGFVLVFVIIGGAVLLAASDTGRNDAPDSAYYASMAVFIGGTLLAWSAFNLTLLRLRGQTAGMYIIGIRAVAEDGAPLPSRRLFLRWFALHPLLFHPLLLPVWGILSALAVTLTLNRAVLVVSGACVLLCVVSPAVSLASAALDAQRRTLADRAARALVVRLEEP